MLTWVQLALAVLKVVNNIMALVNREQAVREGYDRAVAEAAAAILAKTEYAKDVREKIASMDDAAIDAALRDLEPK